MATLKYQDENGNYVSLNKYKINDIHIVQEMGDDEATVMSQKAVSNELNKIIPNIRFDKEHNCYVLDCGTYHG